jgi:hypothetical protein
LWDILRGYIPENFTEDYNRALLQINQYRYRKMFNLSYSEYLKEPIDIYFANLKIAALENKIMGRRLKKIRK